MSSTRLSPSERNRRCNEQGLVLEELVLTACGPQGKAPLEQAVAEHTSSLHVSLHLSGARPSGDTRSALELLGSRLRVSLLDPAGAESALAVSAEPEDDGVRVWLAGTLARPAAGFRPGTWRVCVEALDLTVEGTFVLRGLADLARGLVWAHPRWLASVDGSLALASAVPACDLASGEVSLDVTGEPSELAHLVLAPPRVVLTPPRGEAKTLLARAHRLPGAGLALVRALVGLAPEERLAGAWRLEVEVAGVVVAKADVTLREPDGPPPPLRVVRADVAVLGLDGLGRGRYAASRARAVALALTLATSPATGPAETGGDVGAHCEAVLLDSGGGVVALTSVPLHRTDEGLALVSGQPPVLVLPRPAAAGRYDVHVRAGGRVLWREHLALVAGDAEPGPVTGGST